LEKEKLVGGWYLAPWPPKVEENLLLPSEKAACEVAAGEVRSRVMVG